MSRILIAEDEARLASFLEKGLRSSGFVTTVVGDGIAAESLARDEDFDLLILDLSLPGKDGLDVLRDLREAGERLPVIVLTARGDPGDRVEGLESGADDYLPKPFHFEELVARVRVRLRVGDHSVEQTQLAGRRRRARPAHPLGSVGGETVELSAREFELLRTFLQHPNQVLSPRAAPRARLGLRLRPGLERRRRLRRLPAQEARPGEVRDGPRRRLPLPRVTRRRRHVAHARTRKQKSAASRDIDSARAEDVARVV